MTRRASPDLQYCTHRDLFVSASGVRTSLSGGSRGRQNDVKNASTVQHAELVDDSRQSTVVRSAATPKVDKPYNGIQNRISRPQKGDRSESESGTFATGAVSIGSTASALDWSASMRRLLLREQVTNVGSIRTDRIPLSADRFRTGVRDNPKISCRCGVVPFDTWLPLRDRRERSRQRTRSQPGRSGRGESPSRAGIRRPSASAR